MSDSFFPSIGSIAVKADTLDSKHVDDASADQDRPLQEIESLCMKCEEQVRAHRPSLPAHLTDVRS
jgi:zinc finger protein